MKNQNIAVVMMVKTPGLSPVKTRLAAKIGEKSAVAFFQKSVQVLSSSLVEFSKELNIQPYYAYAECDAAAHWKLFPAFHQGDGGLGQKLHNVYSKLQPIHQAVVIIGSDLPQLSKEILEECLFSLHNNSSSFCIGPTEDGGFYLFGGAVPLPSSVWLNTPYSVSTTRKELSQQLNKYGTVFNLKENFDIDELEDLVKLKENLQEFSVLCPALKLFQEFDWPEN